MKTKMSLLSINQVELEILAYDQLRYFKNKDTKIFKKMTATKIIKSIASANGLKTGTKLSERRKQVPAARHDLQRIDT